MSVVAPNDEVKPGNSLLVSTQGGQYSPHVITTLTTAVNVGQRYRLTSDLKPLADGPAGMSIDWIGSTGNRIGLSAQWAPYWLRERCGRPDLYRPSHRRVLLVHYSSSRPLTVLKLCLQMLSSDPKQRTHATYCTMAISLLAELVGGEHRVPFHSSFRAWEP